VLALFKAEKIFRNAYFIQEKFALARVIKIQRLCAFRNSVPAAAPLPALFLTSL
jgi:hypothetical protein